MTGKEQEKIRQVIKEFAEEMEKKMLNKLEEGFHGWDGDLSSNKIMHDLIDHVLDLSEKKTPEEIDIANFCMMLWHRRKT